jgi:glycosyltransferase involved in cell wall biosynthesis
MRENGENLIKNVVLWTPFFSKAQVMRDPGQIAEQLAMIGYNVRILTYRSDWSKGISAINRVELIKVNSDLKVLRLIGLPLHYYVLRNGKAIGCLILYFASFNHAITTTLFRLVNRRGVCVVKMDSDGNLYGSTKGERNPAKRILLRLLGELTFRMLAFSVDLLIIESPEARQKVLSIHPWLEHKLIMLPNGVNQKVFGQLSQSVQAKNEKKILFVGRVEYAKGVDLLIRAFSRLKDEYPDWNLELVGEIIPSFENEIKRLVTEDMKDRVALTGPLYDKDLVERYLSAKIFCFPSRRESYSFIDVDYSKPEAKLVFWRESFGLALVEAAYFGNAVISSDVGAARYILD